MELYPFRAGDGQMEPVALIDYNVCIHYVGTKHYRKVAFVEPIVPFQFLNIGAIAAQSNSNRTACTLLENFSGEFSQIRWWPLDDVQARMWLPSTTGKTVLENLHIPIDLNIVNQNPSLHLTEIFIWEDKIPWIEAFNATDYALGQCRFRCMGFRYATRPLADAEIKRIDSKVDNCVHISAAGSAGTVG